MLHNKCTLSVASISTPITYTSVRVRTIQTEPRTKPRPSNRTSNGSRLPVIKNYYYLNEFIVIGCIGYSIFILCEMAFPEIRNASTSADQPDLDCACTDQMDPESVVLTR